MRILFVTPYLPSLVRVRPYQFILGLARRGHDVVVLAQTDGVDHWGAGRSLRAAGVTLHTRRLPPWRPLWNSVRTVLRAGHSFQETYADDPRFTRQAQRLSAEADVTHVEHLRAAPVALSLHTHAACAHGAPVVWDSVDCISRLLRLAAEHSTSWFGRIAARLDLHRTEEAESRLARTFERVLVTTEGDRQALAALAGAGTRLTVIPNGVDITYFHPDSTQPREPATLVVSGKMSYHANITMVGRLTTHILPRVWRRRPDVRLIIAGHNPPGAIRHLSADPRLIVTGSTPDLRPYLQRATLAVAPLSYGVGVQNKVLEAMACGTPVVASPEAIAGLNGAARAACCLADDDDDLADAIIKLLDDPAQRAELGVAGRAYVTTYHNWENSVCCLESIYTEVSRAQNEYTKGLR